MAIVATQVKCPECGARLDIHDDAPVTKCAYCGTESRVQRRTQFLEMPKKLPPPAKHEPTRVAREVRSRKGKLKLAVLLLVTVGLPFGLVGGILYSVYFGTEWEGHHLSVADVDGDGVEDYIGFARNTSRDRMYLTAYSGKDGHQLWQTPSLGTYNTNYQDTIAAAGVTGLEIELVADKLAHVDAYELKTGALRWHIDTPEVVASTCHTARGEVPRLQTADKRLWSVNIADGKLTPAEGACELTGPTMVSMSANVSGMQVNKVYATATGPRIAFGYKSPGSRVPMLAALDADDKVLWKSEVAAHDPLTVKDDLSHFAIVDQAIAIVYERSAGDRYTLAVFDRATGNRRFEAPLAKKPRVISGVRFTADTVAVQTWGTLQVYELATGERRFVVGR
jgi:hypothetical protein